MNCNILQQEEVINCSIFQNLLSARLCLYRVALAKVVSHHPGNHRTVETMIKTGIAVSSVHNFLRLEDLRNPVGNSLLGHDQSERKKIIWLVDDLLRFEC